MTANNGIHTCSYYCERPECIKAQRDELRDRMESAIAQQPARLAGNEYHCATCTCHPGMTPAIRFDTTPAEREGVIRDHLIALGWTPPGAQHAEIERMQAERDALAAALEETRLGLRYAALVWVLADEIAWGAEEVDAVVEDIIRQAKKVGGR